MRSFYLNKNLYLLVFCFVVVLCDFDPFADKDLFSINWAGPRESNLLVGEKSFGIGQLKMAF